MNKRRLLKLAELLEADAVSEDGVEFDLDSWGSKTPCGTSACAMGLAVASGAFSRAGLLPPTPDGDLVPSMRSGKRGFSAAVELFAISHNEAVWLFDPVFYECSTAGPDAELAVAKRIRAFVAGTAQP